MVCPFCGQPNEEAARHAQDMRRYQYEFQQTRENVEATAGKSARRTAKVAVIAVLLVLIGINIFLQMQSFSIVWSLERRAAAGKSKEYTAQMEKDLAEGNYIGFAAFVSAKGINCYEEPYEKWYRIYRTAQQYRYAVEQIEKLKNPGRYADPERNIKYAAEYIDSFYESLDEENYRYYEYDAEESEKHVAAMKADLNAMYIAYLGMSKEEAESMETISSGSRMLLIERGAAIYGSGEAEDGQA